MEPIKNKDVYKWLTDRGLSDFVINQSKLSWNGNEIVIPVFDENKKLLFNKYRRNPNSFDGPKYRYETGSTASLFNVHTLKDIANEPVFICEGELDCLLLNSLSQISVTSTGGSGTFRPEWRDYFIGKTVYIVYDKDEAGYKGAMKVQSIIPQAKIILLPREMKGNDLTDYFQDHILADFFKLDAQTYPIPREPSGVPKEKKELKTVVDSFRSSCDELMEIKKDFFSKRLSTIHLDIMLHYCKTRYETYNNVYKSLNNKKYKGFSDNRSDVIAAKEVPITNFINFNYDGFAQCIWHNENIGSMKYNKPESKYPNTVKCYGCGMMGDTIDVVMKLYDYDFTKAVNFILNKK